jgi:tRNA (cytidine/uridine-2'-O-)-methyltransferase
LPMVEGARSINLANTVGIAVYEVLRQWDYLDLSQVETQRGADYILSRKWKTTKGN